MSTAIEWTDETWNPVRGCSRKSEGCRHCYAEQQAARIVRMGKGKPTPYDGLVKMVNGEARWTGVVRLVPERLTDPMRWKTPRRIFVNSMSDLFHESLDDEAIDLVLAAMLLCPHHTFQVLTKRASRMRAYFAGDELYERVLEAARRFRNERPRLNQIGISDPATHPAPWIWLGVSVEDQDAFDERWPDLAATPAGRRFLSCEPLLGGVNAIPATESGLLHWVIAGCESGIGARRCDKRWLRWLRDQCRDHGVPYFLKQAVDEGEEKFGVDCEGKAQGITCGAGSHRKPAGLIGAPYLDGVQHLEFP